MIEVATMGLECREETIMGDRRTDMADRMDTINHAGLHRCLHHRERPDSALESHHPLLRHITTTTGPTTTTEAVIQATISLEVPHLLKVLLGIRDMVDMAGMVASLMAEVGALEVTLGMDGLTGSWESKSTGEKQAKGELSGILIKFLSLSNIVVAMVTLLR